MQNMERQIQAGAHSMEAMDVNSAMVLVDASDPSFPSPPNVAAPTAKRLAFVIAAYKLMDVLYALQSPAVSTTNPQHAKWAHSGILPSDTASVVSTVYLQTNQCEI
jgi:hypothetical protein